MNVFIQTPSIELPEFNCGSRISQRGHPGDGIVLDGWQKRGEDRCCSYCGSLHEDEFFEVLKGYVEVKPGYRFDLTTKSYKRYASRPGVSNASEGGIKFYMWHLSAESTEEQKALYGAAVKRHKDEMRNLLSKVA